LGFSHRCDIALFFIGRLFAVGNRLVFMFLVAVAMFVMFFSLVLAFFSVLVMVTMRMAGLFAVLMRIGMFHLVPFDSIDLTK